MIALKYLPLPFLWISLSWVLCFSFYFYRCDKYAYKAIWFHLAFILLVLGIIEVFSWHLLRKEEETTRYDIQYSRGPNTYHDILGYAPRSGNTIVSKKYKDEQLLYDVTYTIGDDGLRITPKFELSSWDQCIVLFGGSFTFGEGLNDEETMPYLVGKLSKFNTYNFGFYGYGPHQMLSALEQGMVERIVECRPKIAIYQVPRTHVLRSAGLTKWDKHGPEYILLSDGTVKFDGHFDDESPAVTRDESTDFPSRIMAQLKKSFLFKKYIENIVPYSDEAIELFLAIIEEAKKEFTGRFPGSAFHVIFWDYKPNHWDTKKILEELSRKGIKTHLISSILPDFNRQKAKYEISPYDLHPNALAQETIAQYVVEEILNESSGQKVNSRRQGYGRQEKSKSQKGENP